ncbi:amidohydrolase family protein [Oxobacter pfennigii]|uniref:Amidohydrolase family protein n=1 Tax=Oxobacter pfennigii TaxID=36849 RepID=A0A0P9AK29_9CLOT|nr:amidohydrolase family protein [Oxobacter pfennigii]KPU45729.1 amidohydrolase family protein [Oxobacter pfennigii]
MLIEAHAHIAFSNHYTRQDFVKAEVQQKIEWIKENFRQYKKRNINAIRDGGDGIDAAKISREIALSEGIIYKSPVYAIYRRGFYGSFLGKPIDDIKGFKEEFKLLMKQKPDHLKIILTGIVNFEKYGDVGETTFTLDELKYMVQCAKDNCLPVMVHTNGPEGVKRAVEAGADTIEHGYLMSESEIYKIAEKNIIWLPTLAPLGNILLSRDPKFEKEREVIDKVYKRQTENIKKARDIGVKIALGSDSGAYKVEHGQGLLDEIEQFEMIGFDKKDLIRMCFENGAKSLNLTQQEKDLIMKI